MGPVAHSALNAMWRSAGGRLQILSLFMITTLLLFSAGIRNSLSGSVYSADDRVLVVGNRVSPIIPISSRVADQIRSAIGPNSLVSGVSFSNGVLSGTKTPVPTIFASHDFVAVNPDLLVSSADLDRWRSDRASALVGATLAKSAGLVVGDQIPVEYRSYLSPLIGRSGLHVAGIYRIKEDRYGAVGLVVHETMRTEDGRKPPNYAAILVNVKGHGETGQVAQKIDLMTQRLGNPTRTALRSEYAQLFNRRSREFITFLKISMLSALVTAVIVTIAVTALIIRTLRDHWFVFHVIGFKMQDVYTKTAFMFSGILAASVFLSAACIAVLLVALQPLVRTLFPFFTITRSDYLSVIGCGSVICFCIAIISVAACAVALARTERREA